MDSRDKDHRIIGDADKDLDIIPDGQRELKIQTEQRGQQEQTEQHISTSGALDDEQRIKVLSPYMLVFRRFIRNMLAIVGFVTIIVMILFSFVGGGLMPYGESQVFTEYVDMSKDYAGVTQNTEFRFTEAEGRTFPLSAQALFVLALNNGSSTFDSGGTTYTLTKAGEDLYLISEMDKAATAGGTAKNPIITYSEGYSASDNFETDFKAALTAELTAFESDGVSYTIAKDKKFYAAYVVSDIALGGLQVFDYVSADTTESFDFKLQAEMAVNQGDKTNFTVDGVDYIVEQDGDITHIYLVNGSEKTEYAAISKWIVQAIYPDVFLTMEYKDAVKKAISSQLDSFLYSDETGQTEYRILRSNDRWLVKSDANTLVVRDFEKPSKTHWLGTDGNGMDIITRMMYGGRISLMIGFVVVIIETLIGVILGGISGYFGKWIDNLLMRIVDIFNCIPSIPLIIILGAMMDGLRVDPKIRMLYLMLILAFFWLAEYRPNCPRTDPVPS